jgi:hypothetical protein
MENLNQHNEKDNFLKSETPELNESIKDNYDKNISENTVKLFGKDTTLTKTQIVTLSLITMYFFLASAYFALFAPFLPG